MDLRISSGISLLKSHIKITGSKSETNRLLLLQALYPSLLITNKSVSDDAFAMENGLQLTQGDVDIHHAGTAMRFLTAYFASQPGRNVTITGSERMKERPIKILVDALRQLGAEIDYVGREGVPPLKIRGKGLKRSKVTMEADVSSQYISALLLIAPALKNGIELELEGKITSVPYIKMTLALLDQIGVKTTFDKNTIRVNNLPLIDGKKELVVESDWSSASYFYSLIALAEAGSEIHLESYKENSLQGDNILQDVYRFFGVTTTFKKNSIVLKKTHQIGKGELKVDLSNAPDIAQTIAVSCFGQGVGCYLTGLHTLKIKETDRLIALENELTKLGAQIEVTNDSLYLKSSISIKKGIEIETYNDHRMAMAFAPLALKTEIIIRDAEVVSKSYPDFWKDMEKAGLQLRLYKDIRA